MSGPILVTTATGKQGSAAIRALLKLPSPPSTILAVTRSAASAGAQKLASSSPTIKLVEGTLKNVPALFDAAARLTDRPIWGVYSIQLPQGMDIADEEIQGKSLIDEALARGAKHFVYSSVDRGGTDKSWSNPTDIPHFRTKHNIELYLREKAKGSAMTWTILRPVAFMDNLAPGMQSRVFLASLNSTLKPGQPLQWIACRDIGVFAAKAFENPSEYDGKAIGLAGDELTVDQTSEAFKDVTGEALTPTWSILGSALKLVSAELRAMINWFGSEGYGADIEAVRKMHPALMDLRTWIAEDSKFEKK
ncbi:MAG: hypothetical protein HETSPECPRED_001958 [Heterodermia speciosa]|uniref:NmrA-like domain-containing protein n=1 Tax=Heterodermia speciosa TaxID=116794 RepID=A0A8H3F247_9LECA|nr:MAG: hypothetical protein HETSPECPRED_001958 [Heterodermia speciosa]